MTTAMRFFNSAGPNDALGETLARWAESDAKPLVLMIDEINELIGDTLLAVLRQCDQRRKDDRYLRGTLGRVHAFGWADLLYKPVNRSERINSLAGPALRPAGNTPRGSSHAC